MKDVIHTNTIDVPKPVEDALRFFRQFPVSKGLIALLSLHPALARRDKPLSINHSEGKRRNHFIIPLDSAASRARPRVAARRQPYFTTVFKNNIVRFHASSAASGRYPCVLLGFSNPCPASL